VAKPAATVDIIDDSQRFAGLKSEWTALLESSSAASPVLTWEWLNAWWTHLGGLRRLAILAVRSDGELIAIAPLSVSRGQLPWLSRWEFLGTGCAGSDYLDVIARRGREGEALGALEDLIRGRKTALHLDHLPHDSLMGKLTTPLTEFGWTARDVSQGVCPFIRLAGHSWDSFLATIGPAHRATTRRRLRQLERQCAMRFERVTTELQRRKVLEALFAFHEGRWADRGTAFRTAALRRFHLDLTERAQAAGWLRLYALYLNDNLAAALYGFSWKGRFYFYQHGYDPRFQRYGVGRAVLDLTIRAAIDEGLAEFDLLYGNEPYKSAWTQEKRSLARIDLFPPHLGGRFQRRTVEAERTLRTFARRVLSLSAHATQTS
jgi:CelD/BcsL family acetyltransferase involved in cellulose biosynthesis